MNSKAIIALFAVCALALGACSTDSAEKQLSPDDTQADVTTPTPAATQSPNASSEMTKEAAGAYYEEVNCGANIYLTLREAQYLLASQGRIDIKKLREFAPLDSAAFQEAGEKLLSPPSAWPSSVTQKIQERAQLLKDGATRISTQMQVQDSTDYVKRQGEWAVYNEAWGKGADFIRTELGLASGAAAECPSVEDSRIETALEVLNSQRSAIVAIKCDSLDGSQARLFEGLTQYMTAVESRWTADGCEISIQEFNPKALSPREKKAMRLVKAKAFSEPGFDVKKYEYLVERCTDEPIYGYKNMATAKAVLLFCPPHPDIESIRKDSNGAVMDDGDGDYDIGVEILAGTWRTQKPVENCYWERTSPGGDIITNNFITNSRERVTVTINKSDGSFTTEGCGDWTKVS